MNELGSEDNPRPYVAGESYAKGEYVVHNGVVYRSNSWIYAPQVIDPEVYSGADTGMGVESWPWAVIKTFASQLPLPSEPGEPLTDTATKAPPEPPRPDFTNHSYYGAKDGPTEFSWGAGQVAPGYETKSPADGGAYRGRTPRQNSDGSWPRVRRGQGYGVPGERIR
jgi:hypothetical protein